MAFVKLDCGMLDSTLWVDRESREVFITALLMAEPKEFLEPTPQYVVRGFDETGFVVPPGWYGFVPAAGIGIVRRALVDEAVGFQALERLGAPDKESRSSEFEGRRLIRINGGYIVLNFMRYRDRDYTGAERARRYRERLKERTASHTVTDASRRDVNTSHRDITHAECRVQKQSSDAEKEPKSLGGRAARSASHLPADFDLTEARKAYAEAENIDPQREFAKFCDYWRAASGSSARKRDWDAAWRGWCRKAADMRPANATRVVPFYGKDEKTTAQKVAEAEARGEDIWAFR